MSEPIFEVMNLNSSEEYPYSCHVEEITNSRLYIEPHYHYEIELLFFFSGNARVSVGTESYEAVEGEMILVNAMEVHAIDVQPKTSTRYAVIMFSPSVLPVSSGTYFSSRYITPFTMKSSRLKRHYIKKELWGTIIPEQFQNILAEYGSKQFGFEFAVRLGIYQIILWILRNCYVSVGIKHSLIPPLTRDQADRFEKLFQYVEENYAREITSEQIVSLCHINYSYFARQFKLITGQTFRDYLNYVRISKAEQLLLTTSMSVTEIALQAGYSNTSYFIKQFKRYKVTSPSQIRKLLAKSLK